MPWITIKFDLFLQTNFRDSHYIAGCTNAIPDFTNLDGEGTNPNLELSLDQDVFSVSDLAPAIALSGKCSRGSSFELTSLDNSSGFANSPDLTEICLNGR